jgi:hypothetical protein
MERRLRRGHLRRVRSVLVLRNVLTPVLTRIAHAANLFRRSASKPRASDLPACPVGVQPAVGEVTRRGRESRRVGELALEGRVVEGREELSLDEEVFVSIHLDQL